MISKTLHCKCENMTKIGNYLVSIQFSSIIITQPEWEITHLVTTQSVLEKPWQKSRITS
ncbi:unnamed protein product [Ilex paraguariensis]|uniref:Uncharacterized protein n=1 Tax=Ilex paraguariensis TaxID=185542 RepID=A0ABC8UKQ5_9AQUA